MCFFGALWGFVVIIFHMFVIIFTISLFVALCDRVHNGDYI